MGLLPADDHSSPGLRKNPCCHFWHPDVGVHSGRDATVEELHQLHHQQVHLEDPYLKFSIVQVSNIFFGFFGDDRSMTPSDVEQYEDVHVFRHLSEVVAHLRLPQVRHRVDRVWVHGGRIVWTQALRSTHFHRLYLTKIDAVYDADVYFPDVDESLLEKVHDADVPQGVRVDNGVAYTVNVFQTRGTSPIRMAESASQIGC